MNDLIERIVAAIIRQEGEPETALNPGNLRAAPWLANPTITDGFWVPGSRAVGIAGIAHVVALHIAEGNSLAQLIRNWAPASDGNETDVYITNVADWAGIADPLVPLYTLLLT